MSASITVEGISKRYRLATGGYRYGRLTESIWEAMKAPFRLGRRGGDDRRMDGLFWALKGVSFEVNEGEVLGVIGRNGAGKSTLLKILSRITEPTEGEALLYGRVGSLLEVGTGFHPELTGRENIFLNGAILGMRRREIQRKFDEIVAFAELERFIDMPVKRYSSGMQVRLAFAVAAHLDPDVLVVDEVLAVGDLQFQQKSLGKMQDVSSGGRTVLLVSHQMNQIRRLCTRAMWLEGGVLRSLGRAGEVVAQYEAAMLGRRDDYKRETTTADKAAFIAWELLAPQQGHVLATQGEFSCKFTLQVNEPLRFIHHGIGLHSADGRVMWGAASDNLTFDPGTHELIYTLPGLPLRPGPYRWRVSLWREGDLIDLWDSVPDLVIDTLPQTHRRDAEAGLLNLPWTMRLEERLSPARDSGTSRPSRRK
jgi:lipopolysaccharide transport system ATP-binding protein